MSLPLHIKVVKRDQLLKKIQFINITFNYKFCYQNQRVRIEKHEKITSLQKKHIIIEINRLFVTIMIHLRYYTTPPPPLPKPRLWCLCNKCRQIHKYWVKKNNNKLLDKTVYLILKKTQMRIKNASVTWLVYCRYGVKHKTVNQ